MNSGCYSNRFPDIAENNDEDKEFCLEILCGKEETNLKHIVREYFEELII